MARRAAARDRISPRSNPTASSAPAPERSDYPAPAYRTLRGYALDPTLAQRLFTAPISEITLRVPWEPLDPGPRGEYLEVIDYDPSTKCFYKPVDLDDKYLLAQDGLPPSEGTPQFHQQMVYAVSSLTIQRFERALGRKALWAPGPAARGKHPKDDSTFVQRLRIYPHALREANAYYSPDKKALLFGYFSAPDDDPGDHVPGGTVFTCLSHDIIAHETAHALLDGMHRRLRAATNPDMVAFHEAFADIVALLQHFTFPEILAHEIASTRGEIQSQENLLGQMASQFGRATGLRGALRDAIGQFDPATGKWVPHTPDPLEYETTLEPHSRGAILVAAIFDAFLSVYGTRTADLLRLYTGGTGVLPPGAIHPDLVHRLADEASKAADDVLTMCVRALDYCPPVDLTFGEYLRALITADRDLFPDDDRSYRVAFVEAFRQRGIYPRDLRTLSVENLCWRTEAEDEFHPSPALRAKIAELHQLAHEHLFAQTRREIFDYERSARFQIHAWLEERFASADRGADDATFFGLEPGGSFEVHAAHLAVRSDDNGESRYQLVVQLSQTRSVPLTDPPGPEKMSFEGGATVIIDLKGRRIEYCIRKPVGSSTRRSRQRAFIEETSGASLHATYLGSVNPMDVSEPFALLHRGNF